MANRLTPSTITLLTLPPLLWAGNAVVGRVVHELVPPMTLNFLRWVIAFVLLLPLAATSTNAMIKRLGRRWAQLHRLIYLIAPLAILHYWWMKAGKHNFEQPIIWGTVVAVLLGLRLVWSWNRMRSPAPSRSVGS